MHTLLAFSAAIFLQASGEVRYLALGDSFTIGTGSTPAEAFPARLQALAAKRGIAVMLKNLAVNGYSTQEVIDRELPDVKAFRANLVTLAIGANDLVRGRGPEEYRANLQQIFSELKADGLSPSRVFCLPQPDWSRSPAAAQLGDPRDLHAQIVRYNAILAEETKRFGGKYLDLFPLMEQQAAQQLIAFDGLHPNAAAHAAWAARLEKEIPLPK